MAVRRVGNELGAQQSIAAPGAAERDRRRRRDAASALALAVAIAGTALFLTQTESLEAVYMAVHVVSAAVWVGGAVALTVVAVLTERARDPRAILSLVRQLTKIGERVFTPSSLLALASGIALVEKQGTGWGVFWIDFGLAVWALSFVTGFAVIGPRSKKLAVLIPERGLEDPSTARGLTVLLRVARFDAAMLVLVLVDMAAQPSF